MAGPQKFAWHDYLIMALTLVFTIAIGLIASRRGNSSEQSYFMANKQLSYVPVALSMLVSYLSGTVVIGNTAEMYLHGVTTVWGVIGTLLAMLFTGLFIVPLFFPLNITSSFQYLDLRFKSKCVRLIGVLIMMIALIFFMGITIFAPSIALQAVTDIPLEATIVIIGAVGTIYTTIGGMKAVVWTDVFQCLVIFGGVIAVLAVGTDKAGGISEVWRRASEAGRLSSEYTLDPNVRISVWSAIIGSFFSLLHLGGTSQTSVQRYASLKNLREARWAVFVHFPLLVLTMFITVLMGMVVFSYFDSIGCDILRTPRLASPNQLLAYFIMNVVQVPALPGIFAAVLISGALSTVSSSVNSLSAVAWKDLIEPHSKNAVHYRSLIIKGLSALFGGLGIAFSFCVARLGGHVFKLAISFFSGAGGPICGLFILGGFFPFVEWIGASVGAVSGLALGLWVILGDALHTPYRSYRPMTVENCSALGYNASDIRPMPQDNDDVLALYKMSYLYHPAYATALTVVIGILVSLIVTALSDKKSKEEIHPSLIIPVVDRILWCLPESIRRKCWCGIAHDEVEYDKNGIVVYPPLFEEKSQDKGVDNEGYDISAAEEKPPQVENDVSIRL